MHAQVSRSALVEEIDAWPRGLDDARGEGSGDEWLKVLGCTIGLDGAIQFGAALMREPYRGPDGRLATARVERDGGPARLTLAA